MTTRLSLPQGAPQADAGPPAPSALTHQEFSAFQRWFHDVAGVRLGEDKQPLVSGRLAKRVRDLQLPSYGAYLELLRGRRDPDELHTALDLLTTHETYFYREPKHFEFVRDKLIPGHPPGRPFRAWSAACSTGEEPYTLAMVLAEHLPGGAFEVLATDISARVLRDAERGVYEMSRARDLPKDLLHRHCLRGVRTQEGSLQVSPDLRQRVKFMQVNLNQSLPDLGAFDVIFLRNVMIYFDAGMRQKVVANLSPCLRSGGHLIIGHSETLNSVVTDLRPVSASIYRRP